MITDSNPSLHFIEYTVHFHSSVFSIKWSAGVENWRRLLSISIVTGSLHFEHYATDFRFAQ